VTTILDLGNVLPYILQIRQEVKAGRILGPHIYCVGPLVDGANPLWPPLSFAVSSKEQLPKLVRQLKSAKVDVIKAFGGGLSDQMVSYLFREAKKESLSVFIHPRRFIGSVDIMQTGIAAFAHMASQKMSDSAINLMKEKRIHCITTLTLFEFYSLKRLVDLRFLDHPLIKDTTPPNFLDDLKSKFANASQNPVYSIKETLRNVKKMFDAGILIAARTDAPYPGVFLGESIHRELELLVDSGLTPLEAITVATKNAALLIEAEDDWGTLASGKLANVIVIAGRPDRNISQTRNVVLVGLIMLSWFLQVYCGLMP
jgi:imidazolonepropionase-like amidohydrolase